MISRGKIHVLGLVALAVVLGASDVMAQPGRGGSSFFGGRSTDLSGLLQNESVGNHIELSDAQKDELRALQEESTERRNEAMNEVRDMFRSGDREEAMTFAREKFTELRSDSDAGIGDILLEHQMERLKQIALQQDIRRNPQSALEKLLDMVEATDEQKEKFAEARERITKEVAKKIAKINEQAMQQMAQESLTPSQTKEFMGYIGESLQIENQSRGGFRGGQPQQSRGGRGSDRGGSDRGGRRPQGGDDF